MSYCLPGGSRIIPLGPQTLVSLTGDVLTGILERFVDKDIATVISALVGAINFGLPGYCTVDPPAYPSTADLETALIGLFGTTTDQIAAVGVFTQWVLANQWTNYCECVNGPQPPPATPPTPPTDQPTVPPTGTGGGVPCSLPGTLAQHQTSAGPTVAGAFFVPASATSVEWEFTTQDNLGTGAKLSCDLIFLAADGTTVLGTVTQDCWTPAGSGSGVLCYSVPGGTFGVITPTYGTVVNGIPSSLTPLASLIPAGTAEIEFKVSNAGTINASPGTPYDIYSAVFCAGQSSSSDGCCPPDPAITAALAKIQGQLDSIIASLPSLGARSYAAGTAHTGLSGAASLSFTDFPLGVKVNLTTVPLAAGQVFGDPVYYANAGWINLVTTEGTLAGIRVEYDGQFIPFPALVSSLTYSFAPGFVATITEVTAGP